MLGGFAHVGHAILRDVKMVKTGTSNRWSTAASKIIMQEAAGKGGSVIAGAPSGAPRGKKVAPAPEQGTSTLAPIPSSPSRDGAPAAEAPLPPLQHNPLEKRETLPAALGNCKVRFSPETWRVRLR